MLKLDNSNVRKFSMEDLCDCSSYLDNSNLELLSLTPTASNPHSDVPFWHLESVDYIKIPLRYIKRTLVNLGRKGRLVNLFYEKTRAVTVNLQVLEHVINFRLVDGFSWTYLANLKRQRSSADVRKQWQILKFDWNLRKSSGELVWEY